MADVVCAASHVVHGLATAVAELPHAFLNNLRVCRVWAAPASFPFLHRFRYCGELCAALGLACVEMCDV